MADIIRTWPADVDTREAAEMFNEVESTYSAYYFALGKGKPAQELDRLYFTFRGRIVGSFKIDRLLVNDGTNVPELNRVCGEGVWTIKPDYYICICESGFEKAKHRLFMSGFRGWRYFNLAEYSKTPESRMRF